MRGRSCKRWPMACPASPKTMLKAIRERKISITLSNLTPCFSNRGSPSRKGAYNTRIKPGQGVHQKCPLSAAVYVKISVASYEEGWLLGYSEGIANSSQQDFLSDLRLLFNDSGDAANDGLGRVGDLFLHRRNGLDFALLHEYRVHWYLVF